MILDAGVFIALDDPTRRGVIVALVQKMIAEGTPPSTNTAALAQAWRSPATQVPMTRLINATTVHPFGDPRTIGLRCATTDTSDVVAASLAVLADQRGQPNLTTEPEDFTRLGAPHQRL